jgi:hypothetical protein
MTGCAPAVFDERRHTRIDRTRTLDTDWRIAGKLA